MKPDLAARLSRLKKGQAAKKPGEPKRDGAMPSTVPEPPEDWTALDRDVWKREIRSPDPFGSRNISSYLVPKGIPPSQWLFYDTETTGLSGGAGNTAFLIGLGRIQENQFLTTQYFLRDYPGEPVLLNFLKQDFSGAELFISYNGKSFDSHLLQTRFLMNRMPFQFGPQLDLLYPVRQLYRRTLPDCRLGTAEAFLLQMPRQGDIPGSEIPDIWFGFLKEGDPEPLLQVFEHNRLDIVRMADLLIYLNTVLEEPDRTRPYRDLFALGRFLTERKDPLGEELLEQALYRGDPRAEAYLSVLWKRIGEWEKAVQLWRSVLRRRPGLFAGVELAKYLEHKKRAPAEALEIVDRMLRELPLRDPEKKAALQHRRRRLIAKIRKSTENSRNG
jgi:uncharacterized protein